jgi:hypothetical protein
MPAYQALQAAVEAEGYDGMNALVVRTDFSDEDAWEQVCGELRLPWGENPADPCLISDPRYAGIPAERVLQDVQEGLSSLVLPGWAGPCLPGAIFIADSTTMNELRHPLLAMSTERDGEAFEEDEFDEDAEDAEDFVTQFRLLPSAAVEISANLGLGNMDWEDFAGDGTGVYERMVG